EKTIAFITAILQIFGHSLTTKIKTKPIEAVDRWRNLYMGMASCQETNLFSLLAGNNTCYGCIAVDRRFEAWSSRKFRQRLHPASSRVIIRTPPTFVNLAGIASQQTKLA
ncbi:hypothetical protein L9F63_014016, partial [Diploptera punctata]